MHTEMINRGDVDAKGEILATASDDKTVRLWTLPEGRLFRVLRPPMDTGNEGKLFAVALSPDSFRLAAGGWTKGGYRGFGNHNIYFFDTGTGEIINRLAGLENVVLDLDYSPDGKYLAGALSGANGIRVWRESTLTEVLRDMAYADDSYWVEFSPDGKSLVATSYDGHIRLYTFVGPDKMQRQQRLQIEEQQQPFSARFSPDGEKIAVGFGGSSRIAVLSAKDLLLLYWASPSEGGIGDLFATAWSPDGEWLYGAGGYKTVDRQSVVAWRDAGRGESESWATTWNTLTGLEGVGENLLVYWAGTPEWGVFDSKGGRLVRHNRDTVYFNKIFPQGLLISEDGQVLQFTHDTLDQQIPMRFSLNKRRLFEVTMEEEAETETGENPAEGRSPAPQTEKEAELPPSADKKTTVQAEAETVGEPSAVQARPAKPLELSEVQTHLKTLGFYLGQPDGLMGPMTRKAIRDFQEARELPVTGKPDQATQAALLAREETEEDKWIEVHPPTLTAPDLELKSWKNSARPQLNGKPLSLSKNDTAISYSFSPSGNGLVLGTRFRLYYYNQEGKRIWQKDSPGISWAVNVTGNEKLVLGAFSDGTLRWYRLEDGEELLALYPHADDRRWIAWNPNGVYAASVGADTLIGWHLNNELDQAADFFPLRGLRERYYQPETLIYSLANPAPPKDEDATAGLISMIAEKNTLEETLPPQMARPENFPPRVLVSEPKDGESFEESELRLKYRLRYHGEQAPADLQIMLDGRPFRTIKTSEQKDPTQGEINLSLPSRDVEIAVIAENEYGVSLPEVLALRWGGGETSVPPPEPALYVLSVGVGTYPDEVLGNIPQALEDAATFAEQWRHENDFYRTTQVRHLSDANYAEMVEGLAWLRQEAGPEDIVMVFLAGHSLQHRDSRKNTYYFLPANASPTSNTISSTVLMETFNDLRSKIILIVDTAYFPAIISTSEKLSPADIDGLANDLSSPENGIIVFSSAVGTQSSQITAQTGENESSPNGRFVSAFREALSGEADKNQDDLLSLSEVSEYVSNRVGELTRGQQTPVLAVPETIPDFIISAKLSRLKTAAPAATVIKDNGGDTIQPTP